MVSKKLKVLSQFKTPLPLHQAVGIKILLPYGNGEVLEKNTVDIVDADRGIISITLSDFEIQGLKAEMGQNFKAEIQFAEEKLVVLFSKGLNVELQGERKVWK